MSILRNEISSLKTKLITQENTHSTHFNSSTNKIDSNERYERRDATVLSRPLVPEYIFTACKTRKPAFFINTSLTPLRNKILYGFRLLRRSFPSIVKACRSTRTGEVTVFLIAAGDNSGTATGAQAGTLTTANAAVASTSGAALEAIPGTSSGTVPEATTGGNRRRDDRRLVINSKQQLEQFMSNHLNASMESLNIDW